MFRLLTMLLIFATLAASGYAASVAKEYGCLTNPENAHSREAKELSWKLPEITPYWPDYEEAFRILYEVYGMGSGYLYMDYLRNEDRGDGRHWVTYYDIMGTVCHICIDDEGHLIAIENDEGRALYRKQDR